MYDLELDKNTYNNTYKNNNNYYIIIKYIIINYFNICIYFLIKLFIFSFLFKLISILNVTFLNHSLINWKPRRLSENWHLKLSSKRDRRHKPQLW